MWNPVVLAHHKIEGRHILGPGRYNKVSDVLSHIIGVVTEQPSLCFLVCVYFKIKEMKSIVLV